MNECKLVEDLMPLYEEGLVQKETANWMEAHAASCTQCGHLFQSEAMAIPVLATPTKSAEKMMHSAQLKLTIYQLMFVMLSFIFAINTSILNESFTFILSYFVLGTVAYYFYRSGVLALLLAFVPIFIWSMYETIGSSLIDMILGGILMAAIHTLFAYCGIVVVWLLLKGFSNE